MFALFCSISVRAQNLSRNLLSENFLAKSNPGTTQNEAAPWVAVQQGRLVSCRSALCHNDRGQAPDTGTVQLLYIRSKHLVPGSFDCLPKRVCTAEALLDQFFGQQSPAVFDNVEARAHCWPRLKDLDAVRRKPGLCAKGDMAGRIVLLKENAGRAWADEKQVRGQNVCDV